MNIYLNDIGCKALQHVVYNSYKKAMKDQNICSFKDFINCDHPFSAESIKTADNGIVVHNDICYGNTYPNSFADIYYPNNDKKKWPVVVYYHGGGFLFGRKSFGDPLAVQGGNIDEKLKRICQQGFAVINVDYALAPKYRFKDTLLQVDEMFAYLLANQDELNLDMNHTALTGGSAGADITLIYGLLVDNEEYRREVGVTPCLSHDQLKVLLPDEPALWMEGFNFAMWLMLGGWLGKLANQNPDIINVNNKIKGPFFPTWINASNRPNDPFFKQQQDAFVKTAKEQGIKYESVYFEYDEQNCSLGHGYMDQVGKNSYADQAFESFIRFLKENI